MEFHPTSAGMERLHLHHSFALLSANPSCKELSRCRTKEDICVPFSRAKAGKGSMNEAAGYRWIILADSFAKVTHAWLRKRLLPTLQQRKTIGQLGGLPSQQTITGVQIVRLHSIIGQSRAISTATLFIDLRSAFHHMLRELVFATNNNLLQNTLAKFLDANESLRHYAVTWMCSVVRRSATSRADYAGSCTTFTSMHGSVFRTVSKQTQAVARRTPSVVRGRAVLWRTSGST